LGIVCFVVNQQYPQGGFFSIPHRLSIANSFLDKSDLWDKKGGDTMKF